MGKRAADKPTALVYRAELPHPYGINHQSVIARDRKTGRSTIVKSDNTNKWIEKATKQLLEAGFAALPEGSYWWSLRMVLSTGRLDADASVKTVQDTVRKALTTEKKWQTFSGGKLRNHFQIIGPDDKWVGNLEVHKLFVSGQKNYSLGIRVIMIPVADKKAHHTLTSRIASQDHTLNTVQALGYALHEVGLATGSVSDSQNAVRKGGKQR